MAGVTNLGDAGVTVSAACFLFGCFLWSSRRTAAHWLAALLVCGTLTTALKIALYMRGTPIAPVWLASPSGHVAASVLIYGVLPAAAPRSLRAGAAIACLTVLLIAVSRVYVQAHTTSDVLAGACIGGVCLFWFLTTDGQRCISAPARALMPFVLLLSAIGVVTGWRLHLDRLLHVVANGLAG